MRRSPGYSPRAALRAARLDSTSSTTAGEIRLKAPNSGWLGTHAVRLILSGLFDRFPKLKIVFIEGGFGWIPSTTWRMDRHFEAFRSEVPHLKRRPSEYVKQSFWFTTQPIDEPENLEHLAVTIRQSGSVWRMVTMMDGVRMKVSNPRSRRPVSDRAITGVVRKEASPST